MHRQNTISSFPRSETHNTITRNTAAPKKINPIETFIASRSPSLTNGLIQFFKKDGSTISVDEKGMKNSNLPWANKEIKFKVYKKEDEKITEWGWHDI